MSTDDYPSTCFMNHKMPTALMYSSVACRSLLGIYSIFHSAAWPSNALHPQYLTVRNMGSLVDDQIHPIKQYMF